MQECEHYEDCLNDPTRDKDMEVRCRECNDISAELLKHPELNEDAATDAADERNADGLHRDELKAIASLLSEIDNAISKGEYDQAGELSRTAKWRLDRRIETMFA
jgi:hypothetical protein